MNNFQAAEAIGKKILIVEDDEVLRELLRAVLREHGYVVACWGDGLEALRLLKASVFDLMLLDVWLPGMNGLELLSEVASHRGSMRVIVMTQDSAPETVLRAIREHAFDYIHKPFEVAALLESVNNTLALADVSDIQLLSAKPDWVELRAPRDLETAGRIQGFMAQLAIDLPGDVRTALAQVFRELLTGAMGWGGRLDPHRTVRIAYLRFARMVQYRIADPGPAFNSPSSNMRRSTIPTKTPYVTPSSAKRRGSVRVDWESSSFGVWRTSYPIMNNRMK